VASKHPVGFCLTVNLNQHPSKSYHGVSKSKLNDAGWVQRAGKPKCDGKHKKIGFTDEVHARDLPPPQP
ncbi:MAG TPA: hypothetical protein VGQ11_09940, partial [Candidatus Acidoferrales bacterium]|nr:hypothetical protein [Candidatus Acidoferrales bacterium]